MAKSSNSKTVDKKTKSSSHSSSPASSTSSRKGSGIYVKAFVACFFIDGEDLTGPLPRKIKRIAGQIEPGSICAPGVRKFDKSADGKLIAFDLRDKNGKRVLKWIPYVVSEEEAELDKALDRMSAFTKEAEAIANRPVSAGQIAIQMFLDEWNGNVPANTDREVALA